MSGNPDTEKLFSPGDHAGASAELYFVVVGRVGRLILWPCNNPVPLDWQIAFGPGTRHQCEDFLEAEQHLAHH